MGERLRGASDDESPVRPVLPLVPLLPPLLVLVLPVLALLLLGEPVPQPRCIYFFFFII